MGPMEAAAWVAVILFFGFASFCSSAMIKTSLIQAWRDPNQKNPKQIRISKTQMS
jgi:hypothetical protein